jgi:hypothetical protein
MCCSHVLFTCAVDKQRLFEKSLAAELERHPHLVELTPKKLAKKDEPGIMFRSTLRGYFKTPKLCRLWVLQCFDEAIARGEPFVKWVDPVDDSSCHDGTLVFAFMCHIRYVTLHDPDMSVRMNKNGALKSTSDCIRKLQDYIFAHRKTLSRRCNDMLKQKFGMKKHAKPAWATLNQWIHERGPLIQQRTLRLTNFDKSDTRLFSIVAQCLLNLARGDNHPWGVAATKPSGYSAVSPTHKVLMTEYPTGLTAHSFFFFFFFYSLSIRSFTC